MEARYGASLTRRRIVALSTLVAVATLAFYSGEDAAAGTTTCTYDAKTRTVTVTGNPDNTNVVVQRQGDQIDVQGIDIDCGATRFETDKIVINDVPDHDVHAYVVETYGRLAPGHENEPGGSDEIEIKVNLGNGNNWFDAKAPVEGDDDFRVGVLNDKAKINLNAEEETGIDADITITGELQSLILEPFLGNDRVDFGGGAGTGNPYLGPAETITAGGEGRDVLLGGPGPNTLKGDEQKDRLLGKNGPDEIEGGNGDDYIDGGAGSDQCLGGSGTNTVLNCEGP